MGKKGKKRAVQGGKPQRRIGPTVVNSGDFAAALRAEREAKEREAKEREAARLLREKQRPPTEDSNGMAPLMASHGGKTRGHKRGQAQRVRHSVQPLKEALNAPASKEMRLGPNPRGLGLYNDKQRILVVGDGDFSFSLALASALNGSSITATSYDSRGSLREKYPTTAEAYASDLRRLEAAVGYRVDGMALEKSPTVVERAPFERIVFNFPHTGSPGSTKASVASNQALLTKFFVSAQQFLTTAGEIHVTLRLTPFYERWKIASCGEAAGLRLRRAADFDAADYPGYECVRTASGELFRGAPSTESAKTYCFRPSPHATLSAARAEKGAEAPAITPQAKTTRQKRRGSKPARDALPARKKRRK